MVWWANVCLLAASEPVNHYGPRKRLRPPLLSPLVLSLSLSPSLSPLAFSLSFPKPRSSLLSLLPLTPFCLSLAFYLSSFLPRLSHSLFCTFPSFPSVPSSPRCSVLQARYNATRRRPSCIFKRAVLLCSRYRPHHLDRPLDDRSPPSPTSVSPSASLARSLTFSLLLECTGTYLLFPSFSLLPYVFTGIFLLRGLRHCSYRFHACEPLFVFCIL